LVDRIAVVSAQREWSTSNPLIFRKSREGRPRYVVIQCRVVIIVIVVQIGLSSGLGLGKIMK